MAPQAAPSAADLLKQSIAAAAADGKFDPTEFRLSESGACPRYRVAKALALCTGDRPDPDGVLKRGHVIGDWVVAELRLALGKREIVRREVEVKTPYGTGHVDALFVRARHAVEVKSTQDKYESDLPRSEHLAQVQAYLHFRPAIRTAELVYALIGKGLQIRSWPVQRNPTLGRGLEAELRLLSAYKQNGILPPIPDEYSPHQYPCSLCPFKTQCWDGTSAPPVPPAEELASPAARLKQVHGLMDQAKADMERLEELRDRERDLLRPAMQALGLTEIQAGGVRVRRTIVAGRRTPNVAGAIEAGVIAEEAMAPWWKQGEPTERWTVR